MFKIFKSLVFVLISLVLSVSGTLEVLANGDDVCYKTTSVEGACTIVNWSGWDTTNHRRTGSGYKEVTTTSVRVSCGTPGAQRGFVALGCFALGTTQTTTSAPTKPCSVYQYDTSVPSCDFRVQGGKLQFRCVPNGISPCTVYQNWTNISYAQPGKLTSIGISTKAGIYNACVVPRS